MALQPGHVWSQQLVGTECLAVEPAPQISGSRCSFPGQRGSAGLWHPGWHPLCGENSGERRDSRLNKSSRLLFVVLEGGVLKLSSGLEQHHDLPKKSFPGNKMP